MMRFRFQILPSLTLLTFASFVISGCDARDLDNSAALCGPVLGSSEERYEPYSRGWMAFRVESVGPTEVADWLNEALPVGGYINLPCIEWEKTEPDSYLGQVKFLTASTPPLKWDAENPVATPAVALELSFHPDPAAENYSISSMLTTQPGNALIRLAFLGNRESARSPENPPALMDLRLTEERYAAFKRLVIRNPHAWIKNPETGEFESKFVEFVLVDGEIYPPHSRGRKHSAR